MDVSANIADLADELRKSPFSARTETQAFPSGAVWLDVHCAGRLFVFAYQPTEGYFGVDEFDLGDHGIGTHFRFGFADFQSAKVKLLSLLEDAAAGRVPGPART
jgi:hypothetical protein